MGDPGYGGHRREGSMSGAAIIAAFVPTFITAVYYIALFLFIRNRFRVFYAPRTFLSTIPKKDQTPLSTSRGWLADFTTLPDHFVLQHNSLEAFLFLRFLKFIVAVCFIGALLTWPILIPVNATGGGDSSQLDRLSFSNIDKNSHLWAHTVVAWVFFTIVFALAVRERLRLVGMRQACYLNESHASKLSAKTVLFMNAPKDACLSENLKEYFGEDADRAWPVVDLADLEDLVAKRAEKAYNLEGSELDLLISTIRHHSKGSKPTSTVTTDSESQRSLPNSKRPKYRSPPLIGSKIDAVEVSRSEVTELSEKIESYRTAQGQDLKEQNAIFVAYTSQSAAHRAFQCTNFHPRTPISERYLAPQPKEVLWKNVAMPEAMRLSKASLGLAFVIAFTIFFSIPVGLIGSLSNIEALSHRFSWLEWVQRLPPVVLSLISGFVPPYLVSWFVSYVPKLFRHIAKLSGEPTTSQAELKTQAWYFAFQVAQVFLVTTFSSGAASVASKLSQHPDQAPALLAENLPKASNFYLTYFIIQGTTNVANNLLNYSDLFEYLFYEFYWDKTPRQQYTTYVTMKGTPWAAWYPKFANLLVIAIAYACIAPLVLGFAGVGIFLYYLSYRYALLYVRTTKIDTKGEAYRRALKQIPTGIYLAELCLIGLFSAREAGTQTAFMVLLLVLTAIANLLLDRMLKPLETLLGVDIWQNEERPDVAARNGIDPNDQQALHAASHGQRLGINKLPHPGPRILSDFFDSIITAAREQTEVWLEGHLDDAGADLTDEAKSKAYTNPCLTAKTPKLWIPRDPLGASKEEIDLDKAAGITTTDDGAEINRKAQVHWDHNLENLPIFSRPQKI